MNSHSTLVGRRLGPYQLLSREGAGGMGEVYKAHDARLDRIVAIKMLPLHGAGDPHARERFEREARAVAALNHPHICTLHDIGREDDVDYLVMEFLEGQTLAARLAKGPLPIAQALQYAIQIASALDAAHRAGIVHRDLKPANVMMTAAGAKLLDFGLAKSIGSMTAAAAASAPTLLVPPELTTPGTILGTVDYMAPEQVEGRAIDARTDIFAFGALLFEMLTGRKAFAGSTPASVIAAILDRDPAPISSLQPLAPSSIDRVVQKCLRKDADHRWQTARDLWDELKWIAESGAAGAPVSARTRTPRPVRAAWISVAGVLLIALFIVLRSLSAPTTGDVIRFRILPPDKTVFTSNAAVGAPQLAVSPDGRTIVFAAAAPGARPTLWLRSLDAVTAYSLSGTEGAESPFWSPDHRWIGYFADGKLKKIPVTGGPSQVIAANVPENRLGSWGPDDTILFCKNTSGILRVSSSGGAITPVTALDASRQEVAHRFPQFLPDGRHFLFQIRSRLKDQEGVYAGSLDGATKKLLIPGNTTAAYAPSGHLVFLDGDALMGLAFDTGRLELRGQAFLAERGVGRSTGGAGSYSVSGAGTLAYAGALSTSGRLTWFDRSGTQSGSVESLGDYSDFRLSPDQTRLAASVADPKTGLPDIWISDLTRRSSAPFTFGPTINASPVWAPDGARIVFRTTRAGSITEFYAKSAGGAGKEEPVLSQTAVRASSVLSSSNVMLSDWSPDGRYLLLSATTSSDDDLWLVPLAGDAKPVSFLSAPGNQWHGNFSPDSKLVAYSSNESGRFEVKVQTFPLTDWQQTVSTTGGFEPRWRGDGGELYYLSLDQKLMAVKVEPGPSFGAPTELFQVPVAGGISSQRTHYVPSRDGRRFLINTPTSDAAIVPITVVLNWTAALKR